MKVLVKKDLIKATRRLAKLKSMCKLTSSILKESMIFKKKTTKRREMKLKKMSIIRKNKKANI